MKFNATTVTVCFFAFIGLALVCDMIYVILIQPLLLRIRLRRERSPHVQYPRWRYKPINGYFDTGVRIRIVGYHDRLWRKDFWLTYPKWDYAKPWTD